MTGQPLRLGAIPTPVSPLAWGMWRLTAEGRALEALVAAALEAGVTVFDTADIYGVDTDGFGSAEARLGPVLAASPSLRERMVVATKGGIQPGVPYNSSAAYLVEACEASLRRLRTDRIDLYQIHRPDHLAHPAEVTEALVRLRQSGKILEAGVSNYTPPQVAALQAWLPFPLVSIQPELSPLHVAPVGDGVLDQALERRLRVFAWSPLGGGRLLDPTPGREQVVTEVLDAVAAKHGISRVVAAYAWVMAHPAAPVPIVGSQRPERIREAVEALLVRLSRADWYAVYAASLGRPLP